MAIKRKDFQKLADAVNEFQKKLTEGTECAELRDALNLTLFLMQKHYRYLQLKMRDQTKQKPVYGPQAMQPGQFMNNIKVSDDNKFEWTWVAGDSPRMIESLPLAKRILQAPVPFVVQAAKEGDLNMIRQLVEKDPNCVNEVDSYGRTALFYCIHYGQINTMAVLLQCGANPEIACNEGSLPLHIACCYGNAAAADLLLHSHQPDSINYQDSYGRSAVHWAMIPSTTDCLRLLIRYGAILNLRDRQGLSPAMWACRKDGLQHLQLLLQVGLSTSEPDGIERDEQGLTWLHWAVIGGTECFIALMDDTTVQLRDKLGRTAFLFAAEKGCIEALKVMRERMPQDRMFDVDNNGRSALHLATMNGQGRICGYLLDCGLSPEARDNDNLTPIDVSKNRQLNYCLRVFAAHLSASAQPNYRPSAKPALGGISFSPYGTIGEPSPSPAVPVEKNATAPQRMRPPHSETPNFVPRPPPYPNRPTAADGGIPNRLIQSTDQMDSTPITTLQPTPPPPDAQRNPRVNRRRALNSQGRDGQPTMGDSDVQFLNAGSNQQNDTAVSMLVDESANEQEHMVPINPAQQYQQQQNNRGNLARNDSQDPQLSIDQYNRLEHLIQPSEHGDDITVGVPPLTEETLAIQQQALLQQQQRYIKQMSREGSHESAGQTTHRVAATMVKNKAPVPDENADDDMSSKSVHAEKADDETSSSHDSTADTVVLSPSKQMNATQGEHMRHHHHHRHNDGYQQQQLPYPAGLESGPRPFLASAKQHISRDDQNGDDSTPPPSKIPILSSPPLGSHNYHYYQQQQQQVNYTQPQWNNSAYVMQKAQHIASSDGSDMNQLQYQQQMFQQQLQQQQQQQQQPQLPQLQTAAALPNPPSWVHLPPMTAPIIQPIRSLPVPPTEEVGGIESTGRVKHSDKPRKNKSKRANQLNQQSFIMPLQPIYPMQPTSSSPQGTPPPPQTSPSSLVPTSSFPVHNNNNEMRQQQEQQQSFYQQIPRTNSFSRRNVETERFDRMESETVGNISEQAAVGLVSPSSPLMPHPAVHRPPSRRGISNEERERAMYANNINNNFGGEPQSTGSGTPTILSRRSKQNAPILSPSPTGNASPQIRHQQGVERTFSPIHQSYNNMSRPQSRGKTSDSLPSATMPLKGNNNRSSPVISPSLSSSPIPMLPSRNMSRSAANSDAEQSPPVSRKQRSGSPPPALTLPSAVPERNRRRGRIDLN